MSPSFGVAGTRAPHCGNYCAIISLPGLRGGDGFLFREKSVKKERLLTSEFSARVIVIRETPSPDALARPA